MNKQKQAELKKAERLLDRCFRGSVKRSDEIVLDRLLLKVQSDPEFLEELTKVSSLSSGEVVVKKIEEFKRRASLTPWKI